MHVRGGSNTRRVAEQLAIPQTMSLEELEAEVAALMGHQEDLDSRPNCTRTVCNGEPHSGFPYPHTPRRRMPRTPLEQAQELDAGYRERPHLRYAAERIAQAVKDVEEGRDRRLLISMPPRLGKSQLCSIETPTWLLGMHPEWKIGLISHSPTLATSWGRQVRRRIEEHEDILGIRLAKDAGAASNWQTTKRGGVTSRSAPGQSVTGLGFKVMLIDDPVKDFADAHSLSARQAIWDWWTANAVTRLEPPSLVIVIATRWHEDDFIGRLRSKEFDGDPDDWEVISFPAIAEEDDVLGRRKGEPLLSPIVEETPMQALERWAKVKTTVGSYSWAALYMQRPSPAQGAIFNVDWWKFWTSDPDKATEDGRIVYMNPEELPASARWLDSWDTSYKGSENSDFAVGQRWVRVGPTSYLVAQKRGRWDYTRALAEMKLWAEGEPHENPYGTRVHERLVEETANGAALIATMSLQVPGIKPINPHMSKEARARAVTPGIESGHVRLPWPGDDGNAWVNDLLSEFREFPNGANDDQVDALTQVLLELREPGFGRFTVPGRQPNQPLGGPKRQISRGYGTRTR